MAALANDTSLSAAAKRKQLEQELATAQYELQDTYYNRSVEDKQTALDKELEDFQAEKDAELIKWDEYLTNVETLVAESLGIVQANAEEIGATLTSKAEEYNLTVSSAILSPWESGSLAVSGYQETFDTAMSSTMDQLDTLKNKWKEVIDKMVEAGNTNVAATNKENANYAAATKQSTTSTNSGNSNAGDDNNSSGNNAPSLAYGSSIVVKKSATHFGSKSGSAKMASFVPGGTYTVYQTSGDQVLIGRNGAYTGWINKSDIEGFAKGTTGIKENQLALIDELGEEIVMHAQNGKLAYLTKGSAVIPHDISENLMQLGQLDPSNIIDQNRPSIGVHPEIHNTEINLSITYGDMVSIGEYNGGDVKDLEKMVAKQFEKHTKDLNNAIRKYSR